VQAALADTYRELPKPFDFDRLVSPRSVSQSGGAGEIWSFRKEDRFLNSPCCSAIMMAPSPVCLVHGMVPMAVSRFSLSVSTGRFTMVFNAESINSNLLLKASRRAIEIIHLHVRSFDREGSGLRNGIIVTYVGMDVTRRLHSCAMFLRRGYKKDGKYHFTTAQISIQSLNSLFLISSKSLPHFAFSTIIATLSIYDSVFPFAKYAHLLRRDYHFVLFPKQVHLHSTSALFSLRRHGHLSPFSTCRPEHAR
jgi:hypothetical protein